MNALAVVVVHFGAPEPTLACLASVAADPSEIPRRVVLVDHSGTFAATPAEGVLLVSSPGNPGYGAGVNRGVAALGSESVAGVVALNHDVELAPGFLASAWEALGLPGVGAAAGPIFSDAERRRLWYAGGGIDWLTGTVRQSRSPALAGRPRPVGFLPGTALAVGGAAWQAVGGFDPGYFLYHEDLDLCLRLRRRGYRLFFEPGMSVVHRLGAATGSAHASPVYLEELTATRLRAFRPLAFRLYLAGLHTGWVTIRMAWHLAAGGGRRAAAALLRGHRRALASVLRPGGQRK